MLQYPTELVELTGKVAELQRQGDIRAVARIEPPPESLKRLHIEEQLPWAWIYPPAVPQAEIRALFPQLQGAFAAYEQFAFVKELTPEGVMDDIAAYIVGETAALTARAIDIGANPAGYRFFIKELLRPVMRGWAVSFGPHMSLGDWHSNICPVCGQLPAGVRQARDEGVRVLVCSHCETEWRFNRVTCPSCYNDDHSLLGYFTVESVDRWRVSFCKKCGSYAKELHDDAPAGAFEFELALQLDVLAQREGFKPL